MASRPGMLWQNQDIYFQKKGKLLSKILGAQKNIQVNIMCLFMCDLCMQKLNNHLISGLQNIRKNITQVMTMIAIMTIMTIMAMAMVFQSETSKEQELRSLFGT